AWISPNQGSRRTNHHHLSNALLHCLPTGISKYEPLGENGRRKRAIHLQTRTMLIKIRPKVLFKIPSSSVVLSWEKKYENFGRQ
ncbi:MAG: hypothetical protein VW235_03030, partial [Rhodospirillaceae bacterium]